MEGGAFYRRKQFILCGALQLPTEGNPSQIRVYKNRPVSVVPGHAEKASLSGAIILESTTERRNIGSGSDGNCMEDVSHGRETGFNSRAVGMHAPLHDSTDTRNQVYRRRDANDARRSADDIHHVLGAAACAYGIPMSITRAHWYGSTRLQAEISGPDVSETASSA